MKSTLRDLIREAGVVIPDWEPANNPAYCYEWGFSDGENAVVTRWYEVIEQTPARIFHEVLPEEMFNRFTNWTVKQKNRFSKVVEVLNQFADSGHPISVIVVDGDRQTENDTRKSQVKKRYLDPVPWKVHRMRDRDGFVLKRASIHPPLLNPGLEEAKITPQLITRIAYNSKDWHHPTGEAKKEEGKSSYVVKMGFGHEEWLFRNEWLFKADKVSLYPKGTPLPEGISASRSTAIRFSISPKSRWTRPRASVPGVEGGRIRSILRHPAPAVRLRQPPTPPSTRTCSGS